MRLPWRVTGGDDRALVVPNRFKDFGLPAPNGFAEPLPNEAHRIVSETAPPGIVLQHKGESVPLTVGETGENPLPLCRGQPPEGGDRTAHYSLSA